MKIVFVNSSDTFEYRINMAYEYLKRKGHDVTVITSDFRHIEKKRRQMRNEDYISIHTISYTKNISLRRLYSHYDFSKKCLKILKNMEIDLLYIAIPPNSQATIAKYYKNSKTKIIMDIIDMWPESFPSKYTGYFPFTLWAGIRNRSLQYADIIVTECNLYKDKLKSFLKGKYVTAVYWAHENKNNTFISHPNLDDNKINLCYLGSINNIIDVPQIGQIIFNLRKFKPVVLRIIGEGEKRQELINTAQNAGAEVVYYGKIYNVQEKQKIFDMCHYGLNIMKNNVCVGLSMKSIDYFEAGLPIINNLPLDTEELIKTYQCGINITSQSDINNIGTYNILMRTNARIVYEQFFNNSVFEKKIEDILKEYSADKEICGRDNI